LRDAYGRNGFGDACLLARRLVERGVPFVEVSLNGAGGNAGIGWDTHNDNFTQVQALCEVLDPAWATLMSDLGDRGLLQDTLVVWMGEFGRTPGIVEDRTGRDHFPAAWSTVLGGGGIRGGQVVGSSNESGMEVADRPVTTHDMFATVCRALGLDPATSNISNVGRPIRLADAEANPIEEILG
jgi:arylsulfatase A-like enzyme